MRDVKYFSNLTSKILQLPFQLLAKVIFQLTFAQKK